MDIYRVLDNEAANKVVSFFKELFNEDITNIEFVTFHDEEKVCGYNEYNPENNESLIHINDAVTGELKIITIVHELTHVMQMNYRKGFSIDADTINNDIKREQIMEMKGYHETYEQYMYNYLEIDARLCSYLYAIRLHNQLEPIDLYRLLGHEYDNPHMMMCIMNTYDKDPYYTDYLLKVINDLKDMDEDEAEVAATREWYITK